MKRNCMQHKLHKEDEVVITKYAKRSKKVLEHWHIVSLWLIFYDVFVANGAFFLSLWLRFDCRFSTIPQEYLNPFLDFLPFYSGATS